MLDILKRLLLAAIVIAAFVALLTVGLFVALGLLGAGIIFWIVLKLRKSGIIATPDSAPYVQEDIISPDEKVTVIEAEYEVLDPEKDKVKR
mgnify:CR=1 FL=1